MFMIPDVGGKGGKGLLSEEKNLSYHEGLRIGMEQLGSLQKNPPIIHIRVGGFKKKMTVHFVISLILGYQGRRNKICARVQSYKNAVRVHQGCLTSALYSSDATHSCAWVGPNHIKLLVKIISSGKNIILGREQSLTQGRVPALSWIQFCDLCKDLGSSKTKTKDDLSVLKSEAR
jgi:hypothetical protein